MYNLGLSAVSNFEWARSLVSFSYHVPVLFSYVLFHVKVYGQLLLPYTSKDSSGQHWMRIRQFMTPVNNNYVLLTFNENISGTNIEQQCTYQDSLHCRRN